MEDGEIAEQPAAPASTANNASSAPAAAQRKAPARAAPVSKAPFQFRMPDLQRGRAQQNATQQARLPVFADLSSSEQNAMSASSALAPTQSSAPSAAQEVDMPQPQPRPDHNEHSSQHSMPASESSGAHNARQHSMERGKYAAQNRVQRDGRAQRGTAESAPRRLARSRSRSALIDEQQPDSMRRRSSEREPSTHAAEQRRGSTAQRAQREMAPMVSDIEKLLTSVSLQTIRKCVTRHLLLSLMLIPAFSSECF